MNGQKCLKSKDYDNEHKVRVLVVFSKHSTKISIVMQQLRQKINVKIQ